MAPMMISRSLSPLSRYMRYKIRRRMMSSVSSPPRLFCSRELMEEMGSERGAVLGGAGGC